jgi:membrane associated rhomboid family serine protease/tetratricopeptide (TPR) repeat protein
MGLTGNAEASLADGVLLIRELPKAAWQLQVGPLREARIPLDRIENVRVSGADLHFEVKREDGVWTLYFASGELASAWSDRLPKAQSDDYRNALGDVASFQRLLDETTPRHFVAISLVAINIAVFVVMAFLGGGVFEPVPEVHLRWGSASAPFAMGGEGWRLITSQFMHFGVAHLVFNMILLGWYGPLLERMLGPLRFVFLYILSGVTGAAASVYWNPAVNGAGASGAIFGLFGALLAISLRPQLGIPSTVGSTHRALAIGLIAANGALGLAHPIVDNAAHFGGLAGGFVLGFVLPRRLGSVDPMIERGSNTVGAIALACALVVLVTLPVLQPVPKLAAEQSLRRADLWLMLNEPVAVESLRAAMLDVQSGDAGRLDAARRAESGIAAFWSDAAARIAAVVPLQDQELEARRQAIRQYVQLRNAQVVALRQALRGDRDAALKQAGRLSRRIDTLLRSMNAPLIENPVVAPPAVEPTAEPRRAVLSAEQRVALNEAEQRLDAGDLDEALAGADALVASAPKIPEPHLLRAEVLLERGERDAALAAFAAARAAGPLDLMVLYRFGNLFLKAGQYGTAEEILTEVLRYAPRHVEALADRAVARFEQRDRDGALRDARAACSGELPYGCELARQFEP